MALIDVTPVMTSNTTPSPYVVSTSGDYNDSTKGYRAFSGTNIDANDSWVSKDGVLPCWIKLDFGKIIPIDKFSIISRKLEHENAPPACPKSFKLYGSDNDEHYVELFSVDNETNWGSSEERIYSLSNRCKYRYYRLEIIENNNWSNTSIGQIKFLKDDTVKDEYSLSIHKTLKEKLPTSIDSMKDEIHFTEDGGMFISNKDGMMNPVGCSREEYNSIEKRSVIGEELEYGYFKMSADQKTDLTSGSVVKFDTQVSGNMQIENNEISLKKGVPYSISFGALSQTTRIDIALVNSDGKIIGNKISGLSPTSVSGFNPMATTDFIYTPEKDTTIKAILQSETMNLTTIWKSYTYISIHEVGRQIIVDPVESLKKDVEYGTFKLSSDQTLTTNGILELSKVVSGNLPLTNKKVPLTKGKRYMITGTINTTDTKYASSIKIDSSEHSIALMDYLTPTATTVFECKEDTFIYIDMHYIAQSTVVKATRTSLTIQEIGQSVILDNTVVKEISNPLTTSPLEYGHFTMSANQTNISTNGKIAFDTATGNIAIANNEIALKQGVTYEIMASIHTMHNNIGGGSLQLVDSVTGEIITNASVTPVTNTASAGAQPLVNTIYTPQKDTTIFLKVDIGTIIEIYASHSFFSVKEIRNNPVNQYGGFETEILFEGSANAIGTYKLSDSISNYNILLLEHDLTRQGSYVNSHMNTHIVYVDTLNQNKKFNLYDLGDRHFVVRSFADNLVIDHIVSGDLTSMQITKVIGIKGQLPSLLSGGTF